ncbi:MAG: hypothetical protein K9M84_12730 [Spirochaetia bacterium]|nr:hypothetical protein [Spirochaetia bacterium]MCF7942470.1 hypothetical protein [Spirochaetia bacterium]
MITVLAKFLPIFLLILLGVILRTARMFRPDFIDDVKRLIVTVTLPSTLFLSFLTMELKSSYIALFVGTIIFCFLLYGAGVLYSRIGLCTHPFAQFFHTGFEFGMVGVALFSSLFGQENLYAILLLGLGHELFIWFFYVPAMQYQQQKSIDVLSVLRSFLSSPIILAILSALVLNVSGIYGMLAQSLAVEGIVQTLHLSSGMTSPLILLVIGYQLQFRTNGLLKALKLISLRLVTIGILGMGFALLVDAFIIPVRSLMLYAFITFLVLPPPFIIPVFLPKEAEEENIFYNNAIVLYTLITLLIYSLIMMVLIA